MCPTVKFSNNLVISNPRCNNGTNHLVWGHAGYTNVCCTTNTVLASVSGTYRVIDLLGPKCAVNHDGLATKNGPYLLQEGGQADKIRQFTGIRIVVKLTMVCMGKFF
jgi:hypothetical protein